MGTAKPRTVKGRSGCFWAGGGWKEVELGPEMGTTVKGSDTRGHHLAPVQAPGEDQEGSARLLSLAA